MTKEERKAYMKEWYKSNKEHISQKAREWYKDNKETRAQYLKDNKDIIKCKREKYNSVNKEAQRARWRKWRSSHRRGPISPSQQWRYTTEFKNWRLKVYKRDEYICQNCGKTHCMVHAHHIKEASKYPKLRYDINNGITLCRQCHKEHHYQCAV